MQLHDRVPGASRDAGMMGMLQPQDAAVLPPADAPDAQPGTLDHAYNCRLWAPDYAATLARQRERGAAVRAGPRAQLDLRWGGLLRQRLDLFLPPAGAGPLVVHVHGGYWQYQASGKDGGSFLAPTFVSEGFGFAAVQYALCPEVNMDQMVAQLRQALRWIWHELPGRGFVPGNTVVIGHSAGAHLAAMLALTDWSAWGLPRGRIAAVCGISGLYDLRPLMSTYLNRDLRLEPGSAARNSPLLLAATPAPPMLLAVGGRESPEFQRQTAAFAQALRERGAPVQQRVLAGRDHFDAVEPLADPSDEFVQALLACGRPQGAP